MYNYIQLKRVIDSCGDSNGRVQLYTGDAGLGEQARARTRPPQEAEARALAGGPDHRRGGAGRGGTRKAREAGAATRYSYQQAAVPCRPESQAKGPPRARPGRPAGHQGRARRPTGGRREAGRRRVPHHLEVEKIGKDLRRFGELLYLRLAALRSCLASPFCTAQLITL